MKTVIVTWKFDDMAGLADIIESAKIAIKSDPDADDPVVYVSADDDAPTQFGRADLVKASLTDGSFVFDLRLG